MTTKKVIRSQYLAALEMLDQAIRHCPQDLWVNTEYQNQFWQVAYHVLFYTHLYLQPSEEDFVPWPEHKENYHSFEALASESPDRGEVVAYTEREVLEYLDFCRQEVKRQVDAINLEAESGFYWLPFNKLELQFYNIRHLQHHTGELCERLGTTADIDVKWVGMMN